MVKVTGPSLRPLEEFRDYLRVLSPPNLFLRIESREFREGLGPSDLQRTRPVGPGLRERRQEEIDTRERARHWAGRRIPEETSGR
jgi:hypothetical protein